MLDSLSLSFTSIYVLTNQNNFVFTEEVFVNIQASSRSKRSTNGELHPDHFDLSFSSSGLQIHLALHRNDRLTTDVPTFTLKDGKMEYDRPNVSQVIMI